MPWNRLRPPFSMIVGLWWALHYVGFWSNWYMPLAGLLGFVTLTGIHIAMMIVSLIWDKETA